MDSFPISRRLDRQPTTMADRSSRLPKLNTRVRFPSSAPGLKRCRPRLTINGGTDMGREHDNEETGEPGIWGEPPEMVEEMEDDEDPAD